MGYTHYFKMDVPLEITKLQRTMIEEVLKENEGVLANGVGDIGTEPQFDAKVLSFNGVGDESHETMYVEFGKKSDFEFCKTARKEYDMAVCKILLILALSKGFNFRSDGTTTMDNDQKVLDDENWPDALRWFVDKGYESTIQKKIIPHLQTS